MAIGNTKKTAPRVGASELTSAVTGKTKLMDTQDMIGRGDSKATRTARMSFSTTPEIAKMIDDEAYARRISKSKLMEDAFLAYIEK